MLLLVCVGMLAGCATVKQAQNLKDCTYALKSVEKYILNKITSIEDDSGDNFNINDIYI